MFKKYLICFIFLSTSIQSFSGISEESEGANLRQTPVSRPSIARQAGQWAREVLAFNYFLTSVTGYGSNSLTTSKFFAHFPTPEGYKKEDIKITRAAVTDKDEKIDYTVECLVKETDDSIIYFPYRVFKVAYASKEKLTMCQAWLDKGYCNLETFENFRKHASFPDSFFRLDPNDIQDTTFLIEKLLSHASSLNGTPDRTDKEIIIHGIASLDGHGTQITLQYDQFQNKAVVNITESNEGVKVESDGENVSNSRLGLYMDMMRRNCSAMLTPYPSVEFNYYSRGDQIFNAHDCYRFASIYLLARLNGRDPRTLSREDVYRGFKSLSHHNYDVFHEEIQKFRPSLFSRLRAPMRWVTDLSFSLIDWFSDSSDTP